MRYILPKYPNFHYPTIPNMKNTNPSAHYQRWPSILTWESHGYYLGTTASFYFYLVCHTHWYVSTNQMVGQIHQQIKQQVASVSRALPPIQTNPQNQPVHPNQQLRP